MSVAKVIEVTASSANSFDDAVATGVERASKTVKDIESLWINEMTARVQGGKVSEYRVNMRLTFLLEE
ncbi:MAG: dodecin family protein [bacterium]